MDRPIAEVARMSGVTARPLRHDDEIGLLPPARIGSNGPRYYEEHRLPLPQKFLVLRALVVALPEIGRDLADQVDTVDAPHGHHLRLLAERDRLDALAATVSGTIAELEQSRRDSTDRGNPSLRSGALDTSATVHVPSYRCMRTIRLSSTTRCMVTGAVSPLPEMALVPRPAWRPPSGKPHCRTPELLPCAARAR